MSADDGAIRRVDWSSRHVIHRTDQREGRWQQMTLSFPGPVLGSRLDRVTSPNGMFLRPHLSQLTCCYSRAESCHESQADFKAFTHRGAGWLYNQKRNLGQPHYGPGNGPEGPSNGQDKPSQHWCSRDRTCTPGTRPSSKQDRCNQPSHSHRRRFQMSRPPPKSRRTRPVLFIQVGADSATLLRQSGHQSASPNCPSLCCPQSTVKSKSLLTQHDSQSSTASRPSVRRAR
jgi:hypothetical protein